MKAISLWQPWASLLVTHQPCAACGDRGFTCEPDGHTMGLGCFCGDCGERPMVKRFETRSWPCPPKHIGQRMAFHAAKRKPKLSDYWANPHPWDALYKSPADRALPLGAVVGSGIVTACYPIVEFDGITVHDNPMERAGAVECIARSGDRLEHWWHHDAGFRDITDQLPYGDFTPGRFAWLIEGAAPTTERCPWCDGQGGFYEEYTTVALDRLPDLVIDGVDCPVCGGDRRCEPIPAKGKQRIWNWTPS